jgi:hypothetical protein
MSSSKVKLSDQNIADLINKLVQVGKLCDIVQTQDQSYVTHTQIEKEIRSSLESKQILNIQNDLQATIGVPKDLIMKILSTKFSDIHIIAVKDLVVT